MRATSNVGTRQAEVSTLANVSTDRRLLQLDRRAARRLYVSITISTAASVSLIVLLCLLSETVSRVFLGHQGLENTWPLLGVMVALAALRAALIRESEVASQNSSNLIRTTLRRCVNRQLCAVGPAQTRRERSGELAHTVALGIEDLDEFITGYQPARMLAAVVPALVLVAVMLLDPVTVLVLLFAGPMLVLLLAIIGARTQELNRRRFLTDAWMNAHFLDMVQGLVTLKMFGRSREQVETIEAISQDFTDATMRVLRTAFQTSLVLEWAAVGATAFVALEVSLRLMHGEIPFDRALAVLLLTPEFFLPLRQLSLKYHAGSTGTAAAARVFELLDAKPASERRTTAHTPDAAKQDDALWVAPTPPFQLRFEDVSFSYEGRSHPALERITLTMSPGQATALVGPTGAGKSTVAALMLRFIQPSNGRVLVGDTPLQHLDPASWRSLVGWVPQHPYLFHGTVAANIALARPDADQGEIEAAARTAYAHEFIQALPDGYQTPIYENGAGLSGGQRQRIAIARAFLKDAPILVMDEATAHLDAESEELVRQCLLEFMKGRTTLIIAHRLDMAFNADQIAVLEKGRLVASGTHDALLATAALYRTLVSRYQETVI